MVSGIQNKRAQSAGKGAPSFARAFKSGLLGGTKTHRAHRYLQIVRKGAALFVGFLAIEAGAQVGRSEYNQMPLKVQEEYAAGVLDGLYAAGVILQAMEGDTRLVEFLQSLQSFTPTDLALYLRHHIEPYKLSVVIKLMRESWPNY